MLDSAAPYYQAGLENRLCYELTFNDYNRITKSGVSSPKIPDAKYKITNISLEYEIVTQPDLARFIRSEYQHMALLYDKILRHRKIIVNKSDTVWNWAFNMPCKSLKGILVLFEEERSYTGDTSKFYNPKIQKVSSHCGGQAKSVIHSRNEIIWLTGICGTCAEYRKMRNIWTLRNNLILRKTGTRGIRSLTEYMEDWDKRNTRPNGIRQFGNNLFLRRNDYYYYYYYYYYSFIKSFH